MKWSLALLACSVALGAAQWRLDEVSSVVARAGVVEWPAEFEGEPLRPLPLSDREEIFADSFPGSIGVFQCDGKQVILRHAERATRKLHRTSTCLRASGFQIEGERVGMLGGSVWLHYVARRGGEVYSVREQIRQLEGEQQSWTGVSPWYWHAVFHPDSGPWLAVTVLADDSEVDR